jgi:hypothetical protein
LPASGRHDPLDPASMLFLRTMLAKVQQAKPLRSDASDPLTF